MPPEVFVEKYQQTSPPHRHLSDDLEEMLAPSDEWGEYFGTVLYDYLSGSEDEHDEFPDRVMTYTAWGSSNMPRLTRTLRDGPWSEEEKMHAQTRIGFNRLNMCMFPQWQLEGTREREEAYKTWDEIGSYSQDALALSALENYLTREKLASQKENFKYFDQEHADLRGVTEGVLNEIDTAIVLLEAVKGQRLIVLPAPPQFEHGVRAKQNVDFIVIGPDRQVVGVQAKSRVTDVHVDKYDGDIVLVDGRTDLDNELARRVEARRSTLKTIGWAGLIAAQRIHSIKTSNNRNGLAFDAHTSKRIIVAKTRARPLVRNIPNALPTASDRVRQRILSRFADAA